MNKRVCIFFVGMLLAGCGAGPSTERNPSGQEEPTTAPKLIVTLPDHANTPDGCTLDATGNVILSIPNFNNGTLLEQGMISEPSPAFMGMIDAENQFTTWYEFKLEDLHPDTKKLGPMDCAFGPDGNLYVADNQLFFDKAHKSRLLRITMENGKPAGCDVVVEGFICSNGMAWHGDTLYVSETVLIHSPEAEAGQPKPKLLSGVYRFSLEELTAGGLKLQPATPTSADSHLVAKYETSNSTGFGADGVACDAEGNLYCGIFEDGIIYKTTFDSDGTPGDPVEFARDEKMLCCDGMIWREADNKFYVADMLRNAVQVVDMEGKVTTLHANGDTDGADGSLDQPCEVLERGNELIVINMDMPWKSDVLTNTTIDKPFTVSALRFPAN